MEKSVNMAEHLTEPAEASGAYWKERLENELEQMEKFHEVMRRVDAAQKTPAQKKQEETAAAEASRARHAKQKRINEILGLIAALRARFSNSGGKDKGAAAQISMLETELMWLTFGSLGG